MDTDSESATPRVAGATASKPTGTLAKKTCSKDRSIRFRDCPLSQRNGIRSAISRPPPSARSRKPHPHPHPTPATRFAPFSEDTSLPNWVVKAVNSPRAIIAERQTTNRVDCRPAEGTFCGIPAHIWACSAAVWSRAPWVRGCHSQPGVGRSVRTTCKP